MFRHVDLHQGGNLAGITKRIFAVFVLPVMLVHEVWLPGDSDTHWYRNLTADILISNTIRNVLRFHDVRLQLLNNPFEEFEKKFKFPDNDHLL